MQIAIMQPYLFPYIGYFQLVYASDIFVFYDDVNFSKKSWINRNKILVNGEENLFTVNLSKASQNKLINEINVLDSTNSFNNLLKLCSENYIGAPYYDDTISLIKKINSMPYRTIADLAINSVVTISNFLEISTSFQRSSINYPLSKGLEKSERLISITKNKGLRNYINAYGGFELYSKDYFMERGVNLFFIKNKIKAYKQFNKKPVLGLSIIDVLMFNSKKEISKLLNNYEII